MDDDNDVAVGIGTGLEAPGREVIVCRDAESAELVIENLTVAAVILDMRLSGPFRFEGLDLVSHVRTRSPNVVIIAMSGSGAGGLADEARRRGATFLEKPFDVGRLAALIPAPSGQTQSHVTVVPTLEEVLSSEAIVPHFQEVVELASPEKVCAFEALARVPGHPLLDAPAALFRYADRKDRTVDLSLVCLERAILMAASIPSPHLILLNIDSRVFDGDRVLPAITRAAKRASIPLNRIVLELTEQHPFIDTAEAYGSVDRLRKAGIEFAFDDVGVAYSHLPFIARIHPKFLKISQQFGTNFENDPVLTKLVRNIVALAAEFDCQVILEGIESRATADAARNLGIRYGQGFFFGKPMPVADAIAAGA